MKTIKQTYRELIEKILRENDVLELIFKGYDNFAKKYKKVVVCEEKLKIYYTDILFPTINHFYFDYTLDYARLIEMIETDLFYLHHGCETKHFNIILNKG